MISTALTIALLGSQASVAQTPAWSDEFDGTTIDPANWVHMIGNGSGGWGNNELEYYTDRPENSYVSGGYLHIVAREESYAGYHYTSARMNSQNRQDFLYGRIEVRLKMPTGGGIWPAVWMMPTDSVYGGWAASGEIDIMESINQATTAYGTLHYGGSWPNNASSGGSFSNGTDFSQDFHVFRLDWGPDEMRWYVDGIWYHTETSATWYSDAAPGNPRAPFDEYFYFLMNVAVGGNWPGCTDPSCITATFPQEMVIDWVRVYDLSDPPTVQITSPADGAQLPAGVVIIQADATAASGSVDHVEFYIDDVYLGQDSAAPYAYIWNATDGCYTIRARAVDDSSNSSDDTVDVEIGAGCPSTPFYGVPLPIPGQIEAEDFDLGGEGLAYHDCDTGNNGGAYRPSSDVDIEGASEGGYNVGWLCAGEWIKYTVDVAVAGTYTVEARVASNAGGGEFHIEFDGVDATGPVTVPGTGGWQDWVTVSATVLLSSGEQEMEFVNGAAPSEFNISYFDYSLLYPLGDVDHDGDVDLADLAALLASYGACTGDAAYNSLADLDASGCVDLADLAGLLSMYGTGG